MPNKLSITEYVESVVESLPPLAIHEDSEELYQYNGKYYEPLSDFYLKRFIFNHFLTEHQIKDWNPQLILKIIEGVKMLPNIPVVQEFDVNRNLINMQNGIYDTETNTLIPHDPKHYLTTILSIDYDPEQTEAPTFTKFLNTTFTLTTPYTEPDYEVINAILQLGGYALYPQKNIEGLFMFMGGGSNGKSLLIEILSSFFPEKFVTDISLRLLSKEGSFEREPIIHSRLNISGEEKGKPMDAEQIKKITSGQAIMVARKFKNPMRLIPNTLLIMDSNTIPQFRDHTHGTMRRMFFFKFKNRFVPEDEYNDMSHEERVRRRAFPQSHRSKFLPKILEERSAIFNMFMDALRELKDNNWAFPRTENYHEMLEEYNRETDTLGTWLNDTYRVPRPSEEETAIPVTIIEILNEFKSYYSLHFPDTRFSYSTKAIAHKINSLFGVKRELTAFKTDVGYSTVSAYKLIHKNHNPWENDPTITSTPQEPNFLESSETPLLQEQQTLIE